MSETEKEYKGPAKTWSKPKAIATMVSGCVLFLISVVVPAETGSALQYAKLALGAVGIGLLCVGAYFRPVKPEKKQ